MQINIEKITDGLLLTSFIDKIKCFIIYGSSVNNKSSLRKSNDVDMCIVLKDRSADLKELSRYLYGNFDNPDFVIYFEDEILSGLPFRDTGVGLFCVEFFAHGVLVWGENIFKEKLAVLDKLEYQKSHLDKIFENILRIRRGYNSKTMSGEEKLIFLNKYTVRLLRGILLYSEHQTYLELEQMEKDEIWDACKSLGVLSEDQMTVYSDPESLYSAFEEISLYVVKQHTK